VAILIVAGTGVFLWQRSQITRLRAQVVWQQGALEENERRVDELAAALNGEGRRAPAAWAAREANARGAARGPDATVAALRADERRLILDQYSDILAQMNLPEETAARLRNLLTDRVEAVLDAEDAAERQGFAVGSAETARAVTLAIADVDRDISGLVGQDGIRRLDGTPQGAAPEPVVIPEPAAPTTLVTVVVQAPQAPYFDDAESAPAAADATDTYATPYWFFPTGGFAAAPRAERRGGGEHFGGVRPRRLFVRYTPR
jgi:hypothetical protein